MQWYEIKESRRARTVRVSVYEDGRVVVTKPVRVSEAAVERFVRSRYAWIEETVEKMRKRAVRAAKYPKIQLPRLRRGTNPYREAVAGTRSLVTERVRYFSQIYGFSYGTISIRNQKSRWGSCTRHGNLSFNYRLGFLPPNLADYVVVHELCHTREHNHSERFWALVAQSFPDHKNLRKQLHSYAF